MQKKGRGLLQAQRRILEKERQSPEETKHGPEIPEKYCANYSSHLPVMTENIAGLCCLLVAWPKQEQEAFLIEGNISAPERSC